MANVVYDSKAIIPAPLVTINKVYRSSGGDEKHGAHYEITLAGTLLPFRGSPSGSYTLGDPSDAFWTLGGYPPDETYVGGHQPFVNLERKQEALRWLFREDGQVLEWYGGSGSPVTCRPKIRSITFPEGQWADRSQYVVELETEQLTGLNDEDVFVVSGIRDVSEEWQFVELEGYNGSVFEITHLVSAQGTRTFDPGTGAEVLPWLNAKNWCDTRISGVVDAQFASYATGFSDWVNGGYTKSTNVSEKDGSYAITETWTIKEASIGITETTYIEKNFTVTQTNTDESAQVTYAGTIYGIADQEHVGGSSAFMAAKAAIPTNEQARIEASGTLGTILDGYIIPLAPSQKNISVNEKDGIVTFTFDWSAGDDEEYTQGNEATLSFASSDGTYNLVLNVDIQGYGDTEEARLANARKNIPTDEEALVLANAILGDQIPDGVAFSGAHIAKSTALSEARGTARTSWTWTDRDENNVEISVDIAYPGIVSAKIQIPGRVAGPIIQRINTTTPQVITVNYASENHSTKPDADTVADVMDEAGGVPYGLGVDPFFPGSYIRESDNESWNPTTGRYRRTRVHTVTED